MIVIATSDVDHFGNSMEGGLLHVSSSAVSRIASGDAVAVGDASVPVAAAGAIIVCGCPNGTEIRRATSEDHAANVMAESRRRTKREATHAAGGNAKRRASDLNQG